MTMHIIHSLTFVQVIQWPTGPRTVEARHDDAVPSRDFNPVRECAQAAKVIPLPSYDLEDIFPPYIGD